MSERLTSLRLFGVSMLWGINFVVSSYLLHSFSPIFLSFVRICLTSVFLIIVGVMGGQLRRPSKKEWGLLAGAGIFGTLLNQTFYFTGLHHSTAGNAALIIALSPIATLILARIFLKERFTAFKIIGAIVGLVGVVTIVTVGGDGSFGITIGDVYLLFAMLTLSISLLFIRRLTESMSSYMITIYSTVAGSVLMTLPAGAEALQGGTVVSHSLWMWLLMISAGIVAQGLGGFWWNKGVAEIGASKASMFMNIPPFIALIVAHFVLGDPIHMAQVIGGILVLSGVAITNKRSISSTKPTVSI
ncbi:DMT family transporter [Tumebacillus permanentifrigoris]|nr:DMT family transporter [Tumebacillus permanentifrigoris]